MINILFYSNTIYRGGTELALLNLVKQMNLKEFNITVAYASKNSNIEFMKEFPKDVKLVNVMENNIKKEKFDIAINSAVWDDNDEIFNNVLANSYVLWVHVNPLPFIKNSNILLKYNKIICVSQHMKKCILQLNKDIENKIQVIQPLLDYEKVINLSKVNQNELDNSVYKILTIGRISPAKGQSTCIDLAKYLKEKGLNFKWYFIGGVNKEVEYELYYEKLLKQVSEHNLEDYVVFLGETNNPYKYLKDADLSALFSPDEAWGFVVTESKILKIPIIASNTSGYREQLLDGVDGILVDLPKSEQEYINISNKIIELLTNKEYRDIIIKNLQDFKYDSKEIVSEIEELFKKIV
ncbi:MAG: glycosyltransferase [Oscillospiraceae bacterium]|nr:glycosyltransferase [Oscillospiraceae bacterium]